MTTSRAARPEHDDERRHPRTAGAAEVVRGGWFHPGTNAPRDPADPPAAADVDGVAREHLAADERPCDGVPVAAPPRCASGAVLGPRLRPV